MSCVDGPFNGLRIQAFSRDFSELESVSVNEKPYEEIMGNGNSKANSWTETVKQL